MAAKNMLVLRTLQDVRTLDLRRPMRAKLARTRAARTGASCASVLFITSVHPHFHVMIATANPIAMLRASSINDDVGANPSTGGTTLFTQA